MSDAQQQEDMLSQPLLTHLTELRKRLFWSCLALIGGTVLAYIYVEEIYGVLVRPLANAMGPNDTNRLIYTSLSEAFFTYIKVAFFAGSFATFPIIASQLWKFVAPGLYKTERRAFLPFLIATPVLFFLGGALVYFFVLPLALPFFLSFQNTGAETVLPIQLEARVSDYLGMVMLLIFAFGISFQLPVVLALLVRAGIVSVETLIKFRRYAILVAFVVAGILTPPDVVSQTALAIPLVLLYEISIIIGKMQRKKADAA